MQVRDGMSGVVLTIGPGHTLRQAARLMAERKVGAAVVIDPDSAGPGILTQRDIPESVAPGHNPDEACASGHLTAETVVASPNWSLEEAAVAMIQGGFRHLIVVDGGDIAGVVSMRDIVRCWTDDGSICEVPDSEAA